MRNPVGLFLLWRVFMGDDKKLPDEVGGMDTVLPEETADKMKALLTAYNAKEKRLLKKSWISMSGLSRSICFRMVTVVWAG